MPYYSGKDAYVEVNGNAQTFAEWNLAIESSRIDVTNFTSVGNWREFLGGFKSGTITCKGPHDPDLVTFDVNDETTIILTVGDNSTIECDVVILKAGYGSTIETAATYSLEAALTGEPTFSNIF